jgi:uncharacterized protein YwgA
MFTARVKLSGEVVKLVVAPLRPHLHKRKLKVVTVDDDARKKKLQKLIWLLKSQKLNVNVKYSSDENGELIAEVRSV